MKLDKRLLNLVPECRRWIYLTVACNWLGLLAAMVSALAAAYLLQAAQQSRWQTGDAVWLLLCLIAALLLRAFSGQRAVHYSYLASHQIKHRLRLLLYHKLIRLYGRSEPPPATAATIQSAAEGVEQLEVFFGRYVPQFYYSLLAPLTLFALLVWFNWPAALTLLLCVPLIPLSIAAVNITAKKLFRRYWGEYTHLGSRFLDNLQGLPTLKVFQDDDHQAALMHQDAQRFRQITMRVLLMQLNSVSLMDILAYGGAAAGIGVALWQFQAGQMSLAALIAFLILAVEFFLPLRLLGSYFHVAMTGLSASDQIFSLLDSPEAPQTTTTARLQPPLSFRTENLNFAYADGPPVLENVNISAQPGELTVLVGPSGSGKSTVLSLLAGLQTAPPQTVYLNGRPLDDWNRDDVHQRVCWVGHHSHVFSGSLRDNLLMVCPEADDAALYAALASVNLDGFVRANGGLEMMLLDQGRNLSGGQVQRLALARALLYDADAYLLDEAASNIDIDSEQLILQTFARLKRHKTLVMVSHRLSAAVQADRVYVFDRGRVVEQGIHDELLRQNGLYAQLFRQQQALEAVYRQGAYHE